MLSAPTYAGGFATARFGSEHGHAASAHPTAIYYNPAGLALGSGTRVYIEGLFVYRMATYDRPVEAIDTVVPPSEVGSGTPANAITANAGKAELNNFLASPFLAVVSDLGVENLAVAGGVFVPFGGSAEWERNSIYEGNAEIPGAVDGVQRWSNIEGEQKALFLTAAGAYRIPQAKLTVGAAFNYIRNDISTVRARTVAGTDDLNAGDTLLEGRSLVDVSGPTISVGAGLTWQPIDQLIVGASYQSQPGFGEHGLDGTLTNKFGAGPVSVNNVTLRQSLPDIFRLAFAYRPTSLVEVRLASDYTRWSKMERQCLIDRDDPASECALTANGGVDTANGGAGVVQNVMRDWNDTFGVRAGGSYWVKPELETFVGASFDSNAVPDETIDAALMDMNKLVGTLGASYSLIDQKLALTASVTYVFYFSRDVAPRDRDADGNPLTFEPPSRNPDGAGEYTQGIALGSLGVQYSF